MVTFDGVNLADGNYFTLKIVLAEPYFDGLSIFNEGNMLNQVNLTLAVLKATTYRRIFYYHLVDSTAKSNNDFVAIPLDSVVFNANRLNARIVLNLKGDLNVENNEYLRIIIDSVYIGLVNKTFPMDLEQVVTITNDDDSRGVGLSISPAYGL